MMTERDEGTDSQRLAQVWNITGPVSRGRFAARSHRIRRTHRVADNLSPLCVPYRFRDRPPGGIPQAATTAGHIDGRVFPFVTEGEGMGTPGSPTLMDDEKLP
jgi:hypothetical protein